MNNIIVEFNEDTKVLNISGSGDLSWKDTIEYREETEVVVIEGIHIYSTNMSNLFANFHKLKTIKGTIDTYNCKDMSYLYAECYNLTQPIKDLDTSNAEEFDFFHSDNHSLKTVVFNSTLKGFKFKDMLKGCKELRDIEGVIIPMDVDLETVSDLKYVRAVLSNARIAYNEENISR